MNLTFRCFTSIGFVTLVACSADSALTGAPAGHPLIGKWEWTRQQNSCTEVYEYRPDGTAFVVSGSEKSDNTYAIGATPDQRGFYRLTMKVAKDYGGKDCADDSSDNTGEESTTYIMFDPARMSHIVCSEPSTARCFGPLRRIDK